MTEDEAVNRITRTAVDGNLAREERRDFIKIIMKEYVLMVAEKAEAEATKDVEGQTVYSQGFLQGCRKVSRKIKKEVEG